MEGAQRTVNVGKVFHAGRFIGVIDDVVKFVVRMPARRICALLTSIMRLARRAQRLLSGVVMTTSPDYVRRHL